MPSRTPRISGKELVRILERAGWILVGTSGSHVKLRSPDGSNRIIIPVHGARTLPIGTLQGILRQAELTSDDLRELM
jgi:predicted RNA binding protein YcfA (HicA-like mRNA interferase family)